MDAPARVADALVALIEGVELRVGVLLAHVEERRVVLKVIVVVVAEDARAEVHRSMTQ